jgi:hypothetical protein
MDFLIIPAIVLLGLDARNSQAASYAATAYLKQSGIERQLHELQEREFSPELRARIGQATFLVKTISSQSISYTWGFP